MQFWQSFVEYIKNLDRTRYVWYQYAYLSISIICFVAVIGWFFGQRHVQQQNMASLNKVRTVIQQYLTEFQSVRTQKDEVDAMLKKDKAFYIQKYFEDVVRALSITQKSTSSLVATDLANGYTEESLQVKISSITTDVLVNFLQKIKETPRVYIKDLSIVAGPGMPKTIQASMTIATLKPKDDRQQSVEE